MMEADGLAPTSGQDRRVAGRFGVGRRDITPPEGIFFRNWGAATRELARGVHRPFTASALTIRAVADRAGVDRAGADRAVADRAVADEAPLVLVAIDAGWWQSGADEWLVRGAVLEGLGLDPARLIINLSHTHAGPSLATDNENGPGGEHIRPYLRHMANQIVGAVREALDSESEGKLTVALGRCDLASNRGLRDPAGRRFVTGYNPGGRADDTLVVGRVTDVQGRIRATFVNYACHPTTLAWENELLSPDYVGATRETVEAASDGAPCIFLLGACGELAPALQYEGDVAIADRHGRRLGHAASSTLAAMLEPGHELVYTGVVESGAPLAVWRSRPSGPASAGVRTNMLELALPIKEDYPREDAILAELSRASERYQRERLQRKLRLRRTLGDGDTYRMPIWIWKAGDAFFVGYPAEAFSSLQASLRAGFPGHTVVVMNVVNGSIGYLPPATLYGEDMYEVWQTPLATGCLEAVQAACIDTMRSMIEAG